MGTLNNLTAGLMLLWLRPFRIGDFIEVGAVAGTVREMGLFACHLETFDGMFLFAPNSSIWNNPLKNHTSNAGRLVSIDVAVSSNADIDRACGILVDRTRRMAYGRGLTRRGMPKPRRFLFSYTCAVVSVCCASSLWMRWRERLSRASFPSRH